MNECITYVPRNLLIARSAPDFSLNLLLCTGKSLSEALIFASTNPQYGFFLVKNSLVKFFKDSYFPCPKLLLDLVKTCIAYLLDLECNQEMFLSTGKNFFRSTL